MNWDRWLWMWWMLERERARDFFIFEYKSYTVKSEKWDEAFDQSNDENWGFFSNTI